MFQTVPQKGANKPRLISSFKKWTYVIIQVIGANVLFIAETDTVLMTSEDSGVNEALQINQASGIVQLWWLGDMWAAGSAPFKPLIIIPGITTGSMSADYIPEAGLQW